MKYEPENIDECKSTDCANCTLLDKSDECDKIQYGEK